MLGCCWLFALFLNRSARCFTHLQGEVDSTPTYLAAILHLIVVLICISPMASNAEHPYICLWALCMSSWRSVYSGPLSIFSLEFFSLTLSHMSSLYISEIKPLSDVSLANIFSHMVGFLFILLMFSSLCRSFLIWCSHIYFFFPSFPFP